MSSILDRCRDLQVVCDAAHWKAICDRLRADPTDSDALFACAAYLASDHQLDEAIESLDELAEVNPDYPGLWRFKARIFQEMGETELASKCWEKGYKDQ